MYAQNLFSPTDIRSRHNNAPINLRISTSADDPSAWGSATNLDSSLGGTNYTDTQLHQLLSEASDPIYLFYRDEPSPGDDSRWVYSKSTDGGATWAAQTSIYRVVNQRSYAISWSDNDTRIHYVVTNGSDSGYTKLGHF